MQIACLYLIYCRSEKKHLKVRKNVYGGFQVMPLSHPETSPCEESLATGVCSRVPAMNPMAGVIKAASQRLLAFFP
jgi:hypothetical protein